MAVIAFTKRSQKLRHKDHREKIGGDGTGDDGTGDGTGDRRDVLQFTAVYWKPGKSVTIAKRGNIRSVPAFFPFF